MAEKQLEKVIILEDDSRFDKNFKAVLVHFVNEFQNQNINWDLM